MSRKFLVVYDQEMCLVYLHIRITVPIKADSTEAKFSFESFTVAMPTLKKVLRFRLDTAEIYRCEQLLREDRRVNMCWTFGNSGIQISGFQRLGFTG